MRNPTKPHLHSRTLWVNVLAAFLAALEQQTGLLQPLLPVNVYAVIAALLPPINIALRLVTHQGLGK